MRAYKYIVQPAKDGIKWTFGSSQRLADHLNDYYQLDGAYTKDIIQNYFKPRKERKVNPLMRSLFIIERDRINKAVGKSV